MAGECERPALLWGLRERLAPLCRVEVPLRPETEEAAESIEGLLSLQPHHPD